MVEEEGSDHHESTAEVLGEGPDEERDELVFSHGASFLNEREVGVGCHR